MTLVTVLEADWSRTYGIDDIEQFLLDPPEPPPAPRRPDVPYIGPERPGDAFNASVDAGELLTASGWTLHHTDRNGDRHYTRPGKERREGSSATVYTDGHTCVWTDATQLKPRRHYDPFGLYAALHHSGDHAAAATKLGAEGYGSRLADLTFIRPEREQDASDDENSGHVKASIADHFASLNLLDWPNFWNQQNAGADWLMEPLIARGRSHAFYAGAKSGKSLLMLAACAAIATGKPFLNTPARAPQHILYLDYEMTEEDVRERLEGFGYGPDDDLSHFHYALLPSVAPLDSEMGAAVVVTAAEHFGAVHVVIDTMSRAVAGDENEAQTVRDFYRFTGLQLKARGIGYHRLDHSGKDITKGQRGTSAKNDDVDVVQQLIPRDQGAKTIKATHRRMSWVPEIVDIAADDTDGVLVYSTKPTVHPTGTFHIVEWLDANDVPTTLGRPAVRSLLKDAGFAARNDALTAALKVRRERMLGLEVGLGQRVGQHLSTGSGQSSGTVGTEPQNPWSEHGDRARDSAGQLPRAKGAVSVSIDTDSPRPTPLGPEYDGLI